MENNINTNNPDQLFREYDGLINLTLLNLYSKSKDKKIIQLCQFNRKNYEHLFVLRVALMARDIYGFSVEIDAPWWDVAIINWKIRKGFDKINKMSWNNVQGMPIFVDELLNVMYPDGVTRIGKSFSFADIYHQYYEGSCN